jgi:hypothetical protein
MRKQLQPHQFKYVALFIVIVFVVFYAIGGFISEQCSSIGEYRACWKTHVVLIKSPYCPNTNESCLASPELQQHNALVDLLLDACLKAQAESYNNQELKNRISEVVTDFTGYNITAETFCDQPGAILVHKIYE